MAATKPKNDLWANVTASIGNNLLSFVIMIIIFIVIWLIFGAIFGALAGYGGIVGAAIFSAIGAAITSVITLWFSASLYEMCDSIIAKKSVEFASNLETGFNRAMKKQNVLVAVAVIGFVGALIGALLGNGIIGLLVRGLFMAAVLGIALVAFTKNGKLNFTGTFNAVNRASSNSGLFLYLTVIVMIIPIVQLLALIMAPVCVMILDMSKE